MAQYKDLILELCQGRFASLAKYFENLDDNDLKIIESEDMIIYAEPCDRIRMKIFIDKIYNSIYEDLAKRNRCNELLIKPCMTIIQEFNLVYWNIRNKFQSCFYNSQSIYSKDKFTIENGNTFILNEMKEVSLSADMMILLDLSANGFLDRDTEDLKPLIDELIIMYPENKIIIRLRNNRLLYCDSFINYLLSMANVKYIDLCHCPFSSLDRHNFFSTENETLSELIIDKLIYIPKIYVSASFWKKLIKKSETSSIVDKRITMTHNLYYSITKQMALDDD